MTPLQALHDSYRLLPLPLNTPEATLELISIQRQESPQLLQQQVGGPARGLWQFEEAGGVRGVLQHQSTKRLAVEFLGHLGIEPTEEAVYAELRTTNDVLDAGFARLFLYTDPHRLPEIGNEESAFACYLRTWRPGAWFRGDEQQRKKLRAKWAGSYAYARGICRL